MGTRLLRAGPQEGRLAANIARLAGAWEMKTDKEPLKKYCKAVLLPRQRKSIEPIAALLNPENIQPIRQCLLPS